MSVTAWEDQLRLKTYLLGPDDPNPPWQRTGWQRIYPYSMQDNLTRETAIVPYRALHVENEYLHLTVLPELGGHLYSLYDKTARREVFYRNNVVKYGLVARRGAWISGGIEFNFPHGHTCVTVSPITGLLSHDEATGAASVLIGYTDRVSRMRCQVRLTLHPGEARMRQDVLLHNPTPVRQRHYFWANSAMPATDDLRLVFPTNTVRTGGGVHPYPIWNERDLSLYRNHSRANDIFALDVRDDFFGCYYEQADYGMVHWSDHRLNVGKKFFTWGTADDGMIWVDLLTDDDGQYVELQSGRFVDQSTFEFLAPYQTTEWTEYWYPVRGMGGWTWATAAAAVNLVPGESGTDIAFMANSGLRTGELVLRQGARELWRSRPIEPGPGEPVRMEAPAAPVATGIEPLSLRYVASDGGTVIEYRHPPGYLSRKVLTLRPEPPTEEKPLTASSLCLQAIAAEKVVDFDHARELYEQALALEPDHPGAHAGLGLLDYRAGLYETAFERLKQAATANPDDDEARYYLALACIALEREQDAEELLWELMGRAKCRDEAATAIARMALRRLAAGDTGAAVREAVARLQAPSDNPTSAFLWSVTAARSSGSVAGTLHDGLRRADPLNAAVAAEEHLKTLYTSQSCCMDASAVEPLVGATGGDVEEWLELALAYQELGLTSDAVILLNQALSSAEGVASSPMVHYYLAAFAHAQGKPCQYHLEQALKADLAYCFPSRVEEIAILQLACEQLPSAWQPRTLIGNLYASLGRRDEAWDLWQEAAALDDSSELLCRNIALASRLWKGDYDGCLQWYDKAIERAPEEYHLHLERDTALQAAERGAGERLATLQAAPEAVTGRWEIAARMVECLVALERWDEAVALLQAHEYLPWEGARGMHALWQQALTGRAAQREAAGDLAGAGADRALAQTYPRNLGVGKAAE